MLNKFVLIFIFGFIPITGMGQEFWYSSNQVGQPLQKIGWYRKDEFKWTLHSIRSGSRQDLFLFDNGIEVKKWEKFFAADQRLSKENYYEKNQLLSTILFDYQGNPLEEFVYLKNALSEKHQYIYNGKKLSKHRVFDASGVFLYEDVYYCDDAGRLLRVERINALGKTVYISDWTFHNGSMVEESYEEGNKTLLIRYSKAKEIARESWEGNNTLYKDAVTNEDAAFVYKQVIDMKTGDVSDLVLNHNGNLLSKTVRREKTLVAEYEYRYNAKNLTEYQLKRSPGLKEEWFFEYDAKKKLKQEIYRINNKIQKTILYINDKEREEDIFQEGNIFVKVFYENEKKVKEEYIKDNNVTRVKEFK